MEQALINRYQPGGDIHATLAKQYGVSAANNIAEAALSGDRVKVTDAINLAKYGARLDDSTVSNFFQRITTDPFSAPFESAEKGFGTVWKSLFTGLFRSPWVLLSIVLVVFLYLGGLKYLKGSLSR